MAIFLGLVTAVLFGSADFFGGLSAKKTSVINVVAFAHLIGLIGAAAIAPFIAEQFGWGDFIIGIGSGVVGGIGVALLYRGLAIGPMVVVAPLTAITSASVPAIWGVLGGERLAALGWIGVAVALIAIGLISMPNEADEAPITASIVGQSLLAGACFGAMFILFDAVGEATAPWPIVGARLMTSAMLLSFIMIARRDGLPSVRPAIVPIALTGLFDTGSNMIFLFATNLGDLTVVAVLSSLYPAATVVLARFWLDEPMSRTQLTGLSMALLATALIAPWISKTEFEMTTRTDDEIRSGYQRHSELKAAAEAAAERSVRGTADQVEHQARALVHGYFELLEDPDEPIEPFAEVFADEFSLDFTMTTIETLDQFADWASGFRDAFDGFTLTVLRIETTEVGSASPTVSIDLDFDAIGHDGERKAMATNHVWTLQDNKIKTITVTHR